LAHATPWAEAGHEVAWAQFRLPWEGQKAAPRLVLPVELQEDAKTLRVVGAHHAVDFDKQRGVIRSFTYHGRDLLAAGPRLSCWRAPIDNGRKEIEGKWRRAGLDRLTHRIDDVQVERSGEGEV